MTSVKKQKNTNPPASKTELEEIVSMMAHEMRNPLAGIKGFASLLKRDLIDQPDLLRMVDHIIKGSESLEELIFRFVEHAHPLNISKNSTNFNHFIKELILQNGLSEKITFISGEKKGSTEVMIDSSILTSSLLPLLQDRIEKLAESSSDKKITLSLTKDKNNAILSLLDKGPSITPYQLKKIFSPFFSYSGKNGPDLAKLYKVIEAHGGVIKAHSTSEEETIFTITIPLS